MDGGHQKKWSTWLRCRHVDHVNTCVTRCALLCDAPLAPRCVHVSECLSGAVQHGARVCGTLSVW